MGPTLFSLMTHDFPTLSSDTLLLSFADDNALSYCGTSIVELILRAQHDLLLIEQWCKSWGFVINVEKTKAVLFTRKRKVQIPNLLLLGTAIEFVSQFKYLGIWFDSCYNLQKHTSELCIKVNKRVNLLRCLAKSRWCNAMHCLLAFYKSAIRSLIVSLFLI